MRIPIIISILSMSFNIYAQTSSYSSPGSSTNLGTGTTSPSSNTQYAPSSVGPSYDTANQQRMENNLSTPQGQTGSINSAAPIDVRKTSPQDTGDLNINNNPGYPRTP